MSEKDAFMPVIDPRRCNGCSVCVEVCPTGALGMVSEVAVLVRPEVCIYCADCEMHCPHQAIGLPYEIVLG